VDAEDDESSLEDVSLVKAMKMQQRTHLQTQTQVDFVAPSSLRGNDVLLRQAVDGLASGRRGEGIFVDAPMMMGSTYAEHFPPGVEPAPPAFSCRIPQMAAVSSIPIQQKSHYRESFDGTTSTPTSFDLEAKAFVAQNTLRVSTQPFNAMTAYAMEFQYRKPTAPVSSCKPSEKVRLQHYPTALTTEYGKTYGYLGRRKRGRSKSTKATEAAAGP
jgi:hypothetical protein